jgi:hypothetical protein
MLVPLLTLFNPVVLGQAACGVACDSYETNKENCESLYAINVINIGQPFDHPDETLSCMCEAELDYTLQCQVCSKDGAGIGAGTSGAYELLEAWTYTCETWYHQGQNQAYACWTGLKNGDTSGCYFPPNAAASSTLEAVGQSTVLVMASSSFAAIPSGTGTATTIATGTSTVSAVATTSEKAAAMGLSMNERAVEAKGFSICVLIRFILAAVSGFGFL